MHHSLLEVGSALVSCERDSPCPCPQLWGEEMAGPRPRDLDQSLGCSSWEFLAQLAPNAFLDFCGPLPRVCSSKDGSFCQHENPRTGQWPRGRCLGHGDGRLDMCRGEYNPLSLRDVGGWVSFWTPKFITWIYRSVLIQSHTILITGALQ